MSRARKTTPGRVLFVGSGPGDPALLTVRARGVLAAATHVVTDPDVAPEVLELAGTEPAPTDADGSPAPRATDPATAEAAAPTPVSITHAVGEPAEVAKALVAEARAAHDVVRLVAGDRKSVV